MVFRALRNEEGNRVVYRIKNLFTKNITEHRAFLDSDNNICLMNGSSFIRVSDILNTHKVVAIV